jgi:TfuA protein
MTTVVYLGMSLSQEEAKGLLKARYLPPIRRGDLPKLPDSVTMVGIIDGVFLNESAVGHREIIDLLKRGVTVVGGGSMGALRAAELHDLGMIGVGRIFEMYRDGEIEGDDEVALVFDPETFEPLSEPLVNIRHFLSEAVHRGVLEAAIADLYLMRVRDVYYPRRSLKLLLKMVHEDDEDLSDELEDMLSNCSFDLKRSDSLKVLNMMTELMSSR